MKAASNEIDVPKRMGMIGKLLGGGMVLASTGLFLAGCGGGGGSSAEGAPVSPAASLLPSTVTGALVVEEGAMARLIDFFTPAAAIADLPATLYLDDSSEPIYLDARDRFSISGVANGDHSLFLQMHGQEIELPFRMAGGRGLDFGTITLIDDQVRDFTGSDGYRMGWVDEDGDGANDNCVDAEGDGICDNGNRYAGYAYRMDMGFVDANIDGINDRFIDADGDGVNDLTGHAYGFGFGFIDENGDGTNDRFVDADGNGICDLSAMPYEHPFGWADEDGDGVNDRFIDADGNGVNDLDGTPYVSMPGWADLDGDGINDFFADADGDGINDRDNRLGSYGHGFGWVDENGDGVNDRYVDANGDGINDLAAGPFAGQSCRYGFMQGSLDANGDGISDLTGQPFGHGFGWVDNDGDGTNDVFADAEGDGVNDLFGTGYTGGFRANPDHRGGMGMGAPNWPMGGRS